MKTIYFDIRAIIFHGYVTNNHEFLGGHRVSADSQVSALIAAVTAHVFAFAAPAASPPPKRCRWRGTARPPNRHCLWQTDPFPIHAGGAPWICFQTWQWNVYRKIEWILVGRSSINIYLYGWIFRCHA